MLIDADKLVLPDVELGRVVYGVRLGEEDFRTITMVAPMMIMRGLGLGG